MSSERMRTAELTALYRKFAPRVYRICYKITKDHQISLDLRQDVFLKILKGYSKFRGESGLSTWIYSVAFNHCMDHIRLYRRNQFIVCEDEAPYESEPVMESDEALIYRRLDLIPLLKPCLPTTRLIIQLHFLEGFSHEEVAKLLGFSRASVTRRIRCFTHRAKNYSPALGRAIS